MTLRELIFLHPDKFYGQGWYEDESFMGTPLSRNAPRIMPSRVVGKVVFHLLRPAVELADLYVKNSDDPIWRRYLWTADRDRDGQRIYVGDNGKGLEIHRHLHLTERWGTPQWDR